MGKIRRTIALLTALLLLTCGTALAGFTDTSGHWAESAISKWSEEYGILQGYADGTFQPDSPITRGAFAVILDRFLKYTGISDAGTFSDTPGTWCEESVLRLHSAGVMWAI